MNPLSALTWLKPALIAGGSMLILGTSGGFYVGYRLGDAKVDRIQNKILNRTIIQRGLTGDVAEKVGINTERLVTEIRTNTRTIQEKVPVYVQLKGQCSVAPAGYVSVFNAAAANLPLADAPSEPADAPSGITWATVADITADDFGRCHENAARLKGWQDWYATVKTVLDQDKSR